ncbi:MULTISPECIES: glycosyl hydrolase [Cohnella]|uniref:glycosyl hydrolase n=1 Tax=Cohnella TaxID=329857 RepID=UPI00111A0DA8|nr:MULTISPECIES: glycosyl hydrolase [Cohnella]MBN2980175.1 hypothetical protein [Cohnella algarum]
MRTRSDGKAAATRAFEMEAFRSPASAYGIHPFWFWNGAMEDGEIVRQIEEMASGRLGGFFICPRQGLQIPYLSDLWFAKVRLAVATAARYGLEVWLYDEYPYPSGIAGGEVTLAHPEAKQYTLQHRTVPVPGGGTCDAMLPWARLLSARAVPIDAATGRRDWPRAVDVSRHVGNHQAEPVFQKAGLTAYNRKRFFTYDTVKRLAWTAPKGAESWEVHCFLEEEVKDFKYYGTFVDPCNEEAMAAFIALTHDRYAEELGEFFGSTIQGMFTDEIGLLGPMPWSPRLPDAFLARNGYDLLEHIHALYDSAAEGAARVRYDYYQTVHELLRSSYHKQVCDWCEKHGLRYAAEVPSVRMTTQRFSHVPGGDSGHEKLGRSLDWILGHGRCAYSLRYNPKMISSLANQLSRERVLIECFHSVGWSMTLQDARWMIDRLAALGTNFFNFHAFFYSIDGLAKHDAPPSQFYQNPYWSHFAKLGDYVRRISYVMSRGRPDRPIAVVDPTTTFWTHLGNPFHEFQYGGNDEAERAELERLKEAWAGVCKTLTIAQRDFDHLDPELLGEASIEEGTLRLGDARYEAVVLPPMTNLEEPAWRKLVAFREAGGLVIAVGELPTESLRPGDAVPAGMRAALTPVSPSSLVPLLEKRLPSAVRADSERKTLLLHRRLLKDGASLIFLTHQEDGWIAPVLRVAGEPGARGMRFELLDPETGESSPLAAERRPDGSWDVRLELAPYASALVHATPVHAAPVHVAPVHEDPVHAAPAAGASSAEASPPWPWRIESAGPWRVSADRANAVRFDKFVLSVEGAEGFVRAGLVEAKTFIDQCEDIASEEAFALPLRFRQLFGTPMRLGIAYPVRCRYEATFDVERLPEACFALRDAGAISGAHTLWVNDTPFAPDQFAPRFVYDHANRVRDVRNALRLGRNTIAVDVTVERDWDGVADAIYLFGDFGVRGGEQGVALTVLPEAAELRGGVTDGFPFFAGSLIFERTAAIDSLPVAADRFELRFEDWDEAIHDVVEIRVNGVSLGVRPWTPYVWFGPVELLRTGDNKVEVIVTNTLIGLLEGRTFDDRTHTLQPALR